MKKNTLKQLKDRLRKQRIPFETETHQIGSEKFTLVVWNETFLGKEKCYIQCFDSSGKWRDAGVETIPQKRKKRTG